MITYNPDVQKQSGWERHVGKPWASGPPKSYEMVVDQNTGFATFTISGGSPDFCAGGCYSKNIPIPPTANNLNMTLVFTVQNHTQSQSDENDLEITIPAPSNPKVGMTLNGSVENDNAQGGELQISDAASGWINSGVKPGVYVDGPVYTLKVLYAMNRAKGTVTESFLFNEAFYPIDPSIATVLGSIKGWNDLNQATLQMQQTLIINGTYYSITYQHINITAS